MTVADINDIRLEWDELGLTGRAANALCRAGLTPYRVLHMPDDDLMGYKSLGVATVAEIRRVAPYAGPDKAKILWERIRRAPRPAERTAINLFRAQLEHCLLRLART